MGADLPPPRLTALLADPTAVAMAFDPSVVSIVEMPSELRGAAQVLTDLSSPMDPLAPESQGRAVSLYELARRNGSSEGNVTLADGFTSATLHLFDLSRQYNVFVAVLTEGSARPLRAGEAMFFAPRQICYRLSPTGVILAVDDAFTRALGWTADEIVGTSSLDVTHPDEHERAIVNWAELLDDPGGARRIRVRLRHQDGAWSWFESTTRNMLADPDESCVVCEAVDISDEMEAMTALHRREALLARLTEALPTGVLHLDPERDVLFSNARWFELTGLSEGTGFTELLQVVEDPEAANDALAAALEGGVDVDLHITIRHQGSGTIRHGRLSMRPLDQAQAGDGILVALEDTTEATTLHHQLTDRAQRDPLTGLLNRRGILARLEAVLADRQRSAAPLAVLYLDLDKFKLINDLHTHAVGDEVLCAVAERLTHFLRPGDHVGRIGGDEFLMVLSGVTRTDDAYAIAMRLEGAVAEISGHWNNQLDVAVSVGVAMAREDEDCDSLVRRADALMYERKAQRAAARSN